MSAMPLAADLIERIRERLDSVAAVGLIEAVTALQLRAELSRVEALQRLLAPRSGAPLAGRA